MPVTTNHFLGWGILVIFDLTFLPGGRKFNSDFLENVKSLPYTFSFWEHLPSSCPPPTGARGKEVGDREDNMYTIVMQ